jgi:hypothetical protein
MTSLSARKAGVIAALAAGFLVASLQVQLAQKDLKMTYQYIEVPGGDHGSVLTTGAPDFFAFFAKHTKASR